MQGFKSKIEDVREEILRKRRAGKLPGDTTTVLKTWWQQHSKWPYPTVSKHIQLLLMILLNHDVQIYACLVYFLVIKSFRQVFHIKYKDVLDLFNA